MNNRNQELNQHNNLRQLRMMLDLTQKDFLQQFFSDNSGRSAISTATLSNLESKGGERLHDIISAVCEKLSLDPEIFSLDPSEFYEHCGGVLNALNIFGESVKSDKKIGITDLLNRLTIYFADEMTEGRLKRGGQIASDRELAKKLGVGRSALREALKVLDVLGMIDIRLGQGTYLASRETNFFSIPLSWSLFLDGGQIGHIITVRSILEVKSAELAADCHDEVLLSKLDEVFQQMRGTYERQDYEKFLDNDIEFHSCISECSKNPIIYSMLQTIRNLLRRISGTGMVEKQQIYDIYNEHRKIYGSIISHNQESAAKYMQEHVEHSCRRYVLDI